MTNFGAGIYLDKDLDLEVDETGDLRAAFFTDELGKDIAFQVILELQNARIYPQTPRTKERLKNRVENTMLADNRVDSVLSISANYPDNNTIEIVSTILADEDQHELVFPINV